ncbi:hypothetical protein [Haladaptatus sp. DFWS20]|uniref:hypothetical protein n=1 Tax=Haladaptatus sp. DFWS20 TaxID=3403467 RepID=UPI003EBB3C85
MDGGIEPYDSSQERDDDSGGESEIDIPDWEDVYVDRVSDRLFINYDLEKSYSVRDQQFTLYGRLLMENQKQFFHESLNYANHTAEEHLFVRRTDSPRVSNIKSLVDLGHELAEDWIDADEEHFGTEFTFVLVADEIPSDVREFVSGFRDRTLLKYGYYGRYEINLVVVAPDREELIDNKNADVSEAFALWRPLNSKKSGFFRRVVRRLKP